MASIASPPVSIPNLHLHELVPVALKPGPTQSPILQAELPTEVQSQDSICSMTPSWK